MRPTRERAEGDACIEDCNPQSRSGLSVNGSGLCDPCLSTHRYTTVEEAPSRHEQRAAVIKVVAEIGNRASVTAIPTLRLTTTAFGDFAADGPAMKLPTTPNAP